MECGGCNIEAGLVFKRTGSVCLVLQEPWDPKNYSYPGGVSKCTLPVTAWRVVTKVSAMGVKRQALCFILSLLILSMIYERYSVISLHFTGQVQEIT